MSLQKYRLGKQSKEAAESYKDGIWILQSMPTNYPNFLAFLQLLHYLKNIKRRVNDYVLTIQCTAFNHSFSWLLWTVFPWAGGLLETTSYLWVRDNVRVYSTLPKPQVVGLHSIFCCCNLDIPGLILKDASPKSLGFSNPEMLSLYQSLHVLFNS